MAELINEKLEINEVEFERQFVEATKRGKKPCGKNQEQLLCVTTKTKAGDY